MSEGPQASSGKPKGGILTWALWGVALAGLAAVVYIMVQSSTNPGVKVATGPAPAPAKGSFQSKLVRATAPTPAPDYAFAGPDGKPMKVADLKGKVVVLNVWATWCAPCKIEMPTLAKLQAAYAGQDVEVVAVSIDSPEAATKAALFIAQNTPLKFYHDAGMKLPFVVNAPGAPTTIIYGRDGLEKARIAGEADWASPEARALVDAALAG